MTVAELIWKLLYYPYDMEVKVCVRPRVEPAASVGESVDIDTNKTSIIIYGDKPYDMFKEVSAVASYKA